jgi:endonuclease-8
VPEGDSIFRAARTLHRALAGHVVTRFETAYAPLARVDADTPIVGRTIERCESAGKHVLILFSAPEDVSKARDHANRVVSQPSRRLAPPSLDCARDALSNVERAEAGQGNTVTSEAKPHNSSSPARGGASIVLRTHMRMNGSWHLYRHAERWWRGQQAMRIRIDTADWVAVAFNVPVAEFVSERELERRGPVAALGPDLLSAPPFDRAEVIRRLYACGAMPIERALLDQRVIAGIGNIFKSEVLFLSGIHPETPTSSLGEAGLGKIVDVAETLLRSNVRESSGTMITTVRGLRQSLGRGGPTERLYVYGRAGHPCRRCGTPIQSWKRFDARSTYWCPECQKAGGR